jgi:glucose/arabinose dehydrogenase
VRNIIRRKMLAGAVLAAVLTAAACGSEDEPAASTAATTAVSAPARPTVSPSTTATASASASAAASATPSAPPMPTPTPTPTAADGTTIVITVAAGKVTTPSKRVKVKLGETVRLTVTSDVAEELHVHTYDRKADLAPGKPATLEFKADIPGTHEVELEKSHLGLVELQVS